MVEVEIGKPHVIEQTLTYPADFINKIIWGDCKKIMKYIPSGEIDLTVTSPPYDDLRNYNGFRFDYEEIGREIFRITKKGGVLVWVVGDRIVKGDRTLTSFRQALCFQEIGFNVHDIMIYEKKNTPFMRSNAYTNCYEFMFIFSKGSPKTFNPILVPTKRNGIEKLVTNRKADGVIKKVYGKLKEQKVRTNIWDYAVGLGGTTKDKIAFVVPAAFPEKLAQDHILSWTNEGDLVLDPMCGSGTTCKMAKLNNRKYIGIDISEEYTNVSRLRLEKIHQAKHTDLT